jgi:hypothetical protein
VNSFEICKRSFLKFLRGNFLWSLFFRLYFQECMKSMKNHNFNAK